MKTQALFLLALLLPFALLGGWLLYTRYLHPAWRRQRRVIRACEKAFGEGGYKLVCVRLRPDEPSIEEVLPPPLGPGESRYFTYLIETAEGTDPDFSQVSRRERVLLRHYLQEDLMHRPHFGKRVLRSGKEIGSSVTKG